MAPHETDEHNPDAEDGQAARLRCFLIAAGGRVFSFSGRWIHTREQNTEYILSLSYGKDSLACLGAIQHLGWPLDRIVTADVWATDTIPAEYSSLMRSTKFL